MGLLIPSPNLPIPGVVATRCSARELCKIHREIHVLEPLSNVTGLQAVRLAIYFCNTDSGNSVSEPSVC